MNIECSCVTKHVPLPLEFNHIHVKGNVMSLCPTSFYNLQVLLEKYKHYGAKPPGSERKHFSEFIQKIASDLQ